ncbi:MAG TPA: DUF2085 domain-containing protein [Chloroflexota bacterium]|nr:DUF2085 domain-containing protein [Chloroflexota bacterium]
MAGFSDPHAHDRAVPSAAPDEQAARYQQRTATDQESGLPMDAETTAPRTDQRSAQLSVRTRLLAATLLTALALFVLFSPWPLFAKLHAIGRACCAQIPSHTLYFAGQPMPIDSRNSGIYLGVFLVIAMLWLTGRGKAGLYAPPPVRNLLIGFTLAMILDGFNSLEHTMQLRGFYPESNAMRVITGTFSGMALTILVVPLFNRIVWREPEVIAIADDFTDLAGYLGGAVLLILALLQAPSILYWPLSILSIAGLLITLTMVNAAIILVSTHRERSLGPVRDLVIPMLAGLVFTCGEIMLLDLWRAVAHR